MPTFRCDFQIAGDLSLERELDEIGFDGADDLEVTFRNGPTDDEGHVTGVLATVIGPAESIDVADSRFRNALAERLDLLAFVTKSRFRIVQPLRLVEWEAGKKERQLRIFHTFDPRYPPVPELAADLVTSAREFEKSGLPRFLRVALKYFRYGLLDEQPEDQFIRLWLALEIIAENTKDPDPVPILCPECGEPLTCDECGTAPTRVPFAKQAIENLIANVSADMDGDVSNRLFKARHGLMHGRSRESTEAACKKSMMDLVDELGTVTWRAIISSIPLEPDGPDLALYEPARGGYANRNMIVWPVITFEHKGDGPHPTDDEIPDVKLQVFTRFAKTDDEAPGS